MTALEPEPALPMYEAASLGSLGVSQPAFLLAGKRQHIWHRRQAVSIATKGALTMGTTAQPALSDLGQNCPVDVAQEPQSFAWRGAVDRARM
jgi:hypothetical protein